MVNFYPNGKRIWLRGFRLKRGVDGRRHPFPLPRRRSGEGFALADTEAW